MITALNRSKALVDILELFFSRRGERFYLREIGRLLGRPAGSLQRHLKNLADEKILRSEAVGNLKFFSLNDGYAYFSELESVITREARKKILKRDLGRLMRRIKKQYKPEKVILFGSLAKERVSVDGDIDILIVKKDVPARYWDRVKEISPLIADCDVGIDFVIWTPEEFAEGMVDNIFIRDEIIKNGKVLYERAA